MVLTRLGWILEKHVNRFKLMNYYPDDYEYDDEDNWLECSFCGASDPDDLDQADHAGDCPLNPYGYNHPDFLENIKDIVEQDLEDIADD